MPSQIEFFLAFAQPIRTGNADSQNQISCELIADEICKRINYSKAGRNVLLHLLFPDEFERIASDANKKAIVAAFPMIPKHRGNLDQALREIREMLAPHHGGADFDFYRAGVKEIWDKKSTLEEDGDDERSHLGASTKCWIEKSITQGRPDRTSGDYSLGRVLWSPQTGKGGVDKYRFMREVKPRDVILHLTDNRAFTLVSRVAVGSKNSLEFQEQSGDKVRAI
jgi:hypothetical protein